MKRLTTLSMLLGSLFIVPLHAEDTSIESLITLNDAAAGAPAAATPATPAAPAVPPPGAPVFIPSVVNSVSIAQMGFPEGSSRSHLFCTGVCRRRSGKSPLV